MFSAGTAHNYVFALPGKTGFSEVLKANLPAKKESYFYDIQVSQQDLKTAQFFSTLNDRDTRVFSAMLNMSGAEWRASVSGAAPRVPGVMVESDKVECIVQQCSPKLSKSFAELFPSGIPSLTPGSLNDAPLSAVIVSHNTEHDMSVWSAEMEEEREQLTKQFVEMAVEMVQTLRDNGVWADFIDPSSKSDSLIVNIMKFFGSWRYFRKRGVHHRYTWKFIRFIDWSIDWFCLTGVLMCYWSVAWLIDWLIDWWMGGWIGWGWFIDWLIDFLHFYRYLEWIPCYFSWVDATDWSLTFVSLHFIMTFIASGGRPYYSPYTNATFFDTDERYKEFGFTIEDLGCCKCLSHPVWGVNTFVGESIELCRLYCIDILCWRSCYVLPFPFSLMSFHVLRVVFFSGTILTTATPSHPILKEIIQSKTE